jgi:hypothetical protein
MSTPWKGVLNYSCVFAQGLDDKDLIQQTLTWKMYDNGRYLGYLDPVFHSGDEVFHLKSFLNAATPFLGECNDFANFLTCMVRSLGAGSAVSTRTYPYSAMYFPDGPFYQTSGWGIKTKEFIKAGTTSSMTTTFTYHQFVKVGDLFFDSSMKLKPSTAFSYVLGWTEYTYKAALLDYYRYWVFDEEILNPTGNP